MKKITYYFIVLALGAVSCKKCNPDDHIVEPPTPATVLWATSFETPDSTDYSGSYSYGFGGAGATEGKVAGGGANPAAITGSMIYAISGNAPVAGANTTPYYLTGFGWEPGMIQPAGTVQDSIKFDANDAIRFSYNFGANTNTRLTLQIIDVDGEAWVSQIGGYTGGTANTWHTVDATISSFVRDNTDNANPNIDNKLFNNVYKNINKFQFVIGENGGVAGNPLSAFVDDFQIVKNP
jgi:hypothetical protein